LEHFPRGQILEVLRNWVRVLKPGGRLRVAVPDFEKVAQNYLDGVEQPTEAFVMGGQIDQHDFHKAVFFCAFEAFVPLGIRLHKLGGAYWGQALTKCLEQIMDKDAPDAIITLDYDTVFTVGNAAQLIQLAMVYPDADAIAPIQSSRHLPTALFTVKDQNGRNQSRIELASFAGDLRPSATAHFGLTLLRTEKLKALSRPWFHSTPDRDGRWGDGKTDEDEGFWKRWEAAGHSLFLASRIAVGHAELMVRWPGKDLQAFYQPITEFNLNGPPEGVWS
jgi:hypothetical protein